MGKHRTSWVGRAALIVCLTPAQGLWADSPEDLAARMIREARSPLGLAVQVGCTDGRVMAALAGSGKFLVHGLAPDDGALSKVRDDLSARGLYGSATAERWGGETLPYADNLVNVVIADAGARPAATLREIVRVMCPYGTAFVRLPEGSPMPDPGESGTSAWERLADGWVRFHKRWPKEMDEWTHRYHDAGASCVSKDTAVRWGRGELRWLAGPAWPMVHGGPALPGFSNWRGNMRGMASANGRNFYVSTVDPENYGRKGSARVSAEDRGGPAESAVTYLIARDAFNGLNLWSRSTIDYAAELGAQKDVGEPGTEQHHDVSKKFGETLVAVKDRVYGVLAGGAISVEAASGRMLTVFEKGTWPRKLLVEEGVLILADNAAIRAYDPLDGKQLWKTATSVEDVQEKHSSVMAGIAAGSGAVFAVTQGSGALVAVDLRSGQKRWETPLRPLEGAAKRIGFCKADLVVLGQGSRGRDFNMNGIHVFSAKDGRHLWSSPTEPSRFGRLLFAGGDILIPARQTAVKEPRAGRGEVGQGAPPAAGEGAAPAGTGEARQRTRPAPTTDRAAGEVRQRTRPAPTTDRAAGEVRQRTRPAAGERVQPATRPAAATGRAPAGAGEAQPAAARAAPKNQVQVAALDPLTGAVKRTFLAPVQGSGICRYGRIVGTEQYLVGSSRLADIRDGNQDDFATFRSECATGSKVANGLLYQTPYGCNCSRAGVRGYAAYGSPDPGALEKDGKLKGGGKFEAGPLAGKVTLSAEKGGETDWPTFRRDPQRSGGTEAAAPADLKLLWSAKVDEQNPESRLLRGEWMTNWLGGDRLTAPSVADGLVFVGSLESQRVTAIDAKSGAVRWTFTAGGRLDTPPTLFRGLCLFGAYDGWVYCLRASDGGLVWRYRPGPQERRIMAFGQFESPWPVVGGVLVEKGVAHVAAGRGTGGGLDGGIYSCQLDPLTGKVLGQSHADTYSTIPDILVSSGEGGGRGGGGVRRANSGKGGLGADGTWFLQGFGEETMTRVMDRTWHRPTDNPSIWNGWERAPSMQALGGCHGNLVVGSQSRQAAFAMIKTSTHLVAWSGQPPAPGAAAPEWARFHVPGEKWPRNEGYWQDKRVWDKMRHRWHHVFQTRIEAMALAGDVLFAGGPADLLNRDRGEGRLWAFAAGDGKRLAEVKLDARPASDGLAVAQGRLFVATQDGKVLCFGAP